jgi:hypothetical protein
MNEEKRDLCRARVSRDMVQITYECRQTDDARYPGSLRAHATFDHQAALLLNTHPSKRRIREYGRGLYDLLLLADPKQNVSAVFKRCFDDPSSVVQMSIEMFDETLADLLELGWEHLCDRDDRYLALESRFRLVRRLASLPLGVHEPFDGLPRILAVISSPDNLEGFAVEALGPEGPEEQSFAPIEAPFQPQQTLGLAELFDALESAGQIAGYGILRGPLPPPHEQHPALLPGYPTLDGIHDVLQAAQRAGQPYHVVHFLAHGYLDPHGNGHLLLTNEMGDAAPIHQNAFQSLFPKTHQVGLVLFAACLSGSGEQRVGQPLAGLAPTLLRLDIPAVIAMQDEISVRGAAAFTGAFYQELTTHGYIDTAMVEARREIDRRDPSRSEWVIPVLYLQSQNPRLFRPGVTGHAGQEAIASPFYTGGRINDPSLFFGRQRIVREICSELRKGCNVSIAGESQIGKSSLLYYLYQTRADWQSEGTIEFIDLQCVLDEADFCETVLSKLGENGDSLRDLKHVLSGRRLILLLDEVERLAEEDFNPRLHDLLRSLAQEPHFAMCLSTRHPLIDVFPARTPGGVSPFHNIFTIKTLGPFTESEARGLIDACLASTGVRFSEREIERLLAESHYHPARLQAGAKALFEEKVL